MKALTKKILSCLLAMSLLSASSYAAIAQETDAEFVRAYDSYTVKEFLERYKGALPECTDANLNALLGSGMKFETQFGDCVAVVSGDTNGDGVVNSTDYLKLKNHFLKILSLEGAYFKAADVNEDGAVDSADLIQIKSHFLGTYSLNSSMKIDAGNGVCCIYNPVKYFEDRVTEKSDLAFLLKVRVDKIDTSVSWNGKTVDYQNTNKALYHTMPVSLTVTELLSENAKEKFTVGQKLAAGQDRVLLTKNNDGSYNLNMRSTQSQLPLTEVGREYIVMVEDAALLGARQR
jgi:hypothetical protein